MEAIVQLIVGFLVLVGVIALAAFPLRRTFQGLVERPDTRGPVDQGVEHAEATKRNVVEEGSYKGRKWRRHDDGAVEGELLNGSFRRFASFDDFVGYID